jgi:hypothetical protein
VDEHSTPAGVDRTVRGDARLASVRLSLSFVWAARSSSVGRLRAPAAAVRRLAVLAEESAALQSGRHFDSDLDEVFWDVRVRHAFTTSLSALVAPGSVRRRRSRSPTRRGPSSRRFLRRRGIFGGGLSGQLGRPS